MTRILLALSLCCAGLLLCALPAPATVSAEDSQADGTDPDLLPQVAVELVAGVDAGTVAARHGGSVRHAIGSLADWYLLSFSDAAQAAAAAVAMQDDPDVMQALQQERIAFVYMTNDTYYSQQWHLSNSGTAGADLNVEAAWTLGYTGAGINITVTDDALEHTHPDISPNYVAANSWNFAENNADPAPAGESSLR